MKAEIDERLAVAQAGVDDNKLQESNLDALLNFVETILLDPVSFWLHCPILRGQVKSGQRGSGQNRPTDVARDNVLLSHLLLIRQVCFRSPAPWSAFQDVTVV